MSFDKSVMRFAHANGHTQCCFTEDGSHIITAGSDGDIRIWNGINDDDPSSKCVGEFVMALAHYAQRILVATDLNTVQALTFPDGDRDGTEFRFTAAVTCMRVDAKFIAAGSEDAVIKVVDVDKMAEPFELRGHEGPVLHIDMHPVAEWLASAGGDGTIRIWDLKAKKEIKCIQGLAKTKSFEAAKTFVSPCFEPVHCKTMAYCNRTQIIVVDTVNWDTVSTLRYKTNTAEFTVCRYSPCGSFLAAGTVNGDICVWRVRSGEAIDVMNTDDVQAQPITTLYWNAHSAGELAYTDNSGQLGTITYNAVDDSDDGNVVATGSSNAIFDDDLDNDVRHDVDDDDDEDNENCVSLERLKNATMKTAGRSRHDDVDDIDDLLDRQAASRAADAADAAAAVKLVPLQGAFQPAATPAQLEHRYLVWNSVGLVRAHSSDAENSIEVDFHDASVHHSIHMSNYLNHTMASLSRTVLALAREAPSKLVCIALGASSREWSTSLPDCDEIVALVATDRLVAFASNIRQLHIFSCMGTQREVIGLPGPVVSLAGHANSLCVVYHTATASTSKEQPLAAMLVELIGLSVRCRIVPLTLSAEARLRWLGYTERGSPVCADSTGRVWLYSNRGNYWMPICNTTEHCKNVSDTYCVIDVCEQQQIVRAILCRGATHPVTTPKPIVQELPMQIPLYDLDTEKSQLEEQLLRVASMDVANSERLMKEVPIKLFALACRSEMEMRAKELIEMIATPVLLPLAIKYASKLGRIHLAEKLGELVPQFEELERESEKQSATIEAEAMRLLQTAPMGATLLLNGGQGGAQRSDVGSSIVPRPLFISQQKRNPFKRGLTGSLSGKSSPVAANVLSHLTSKAVGFDESQTSEDGVASLDDAANKAPENNENKQKIVNTGTTFMSWFQENRESLQAEYPDAIAADLTKHAMRRFKALTADNGAGASGNKRKLSAEDGRPSSMSKLAKFGFSKN